MFITRRAMTALDELRQLREHYGDAGPSVFGMTAKTNNRRVKAAAQAAGLGEGFSSHSGRVGLARRMDGAGAPDSAIMPQGRWSSSAMVVKYTRGESAGDAPGGWNRGLGREVVNPSPHRCVLPWTAPTTSNRGGPANAPAPCMLEGKWKQPFRSSLTTVDTKPPRCWRPTPGPTWVPLPLR